MHPLRTCSRLCGTKRQLTLLPSSWYPQAAVEKGELDEAQGLLLDLKVKLLGFKSLPPWFEASSSAGKELLVARDIMEEAVALAVKARDADAFERNFLQLRAYYTDTEGSLGPSDQEHPILGLNLLRLLVQNRLAEFHTELEMLSPTARADKHVAYVLGLEQSMMEGAYGKLLLASQSSPAQIYKGFIEQLIDTVRDDITDCCEHAYESLAVEEAQKMWMVNSREEVLACAAERGWEVRDGRVLFKAPAAPLPLVEDLDSFNTIKNTLIYAKELERIV